MKTNTKDNINKLQLTSQDIPEIINDIFNIYNTNNDSVNTLLAFPHRCNSNTALSLLLTMYIETGIENNILNYPIVLVTSNENAKEEIKIPGVIVTDNLSNKISHTVYPLQFEPHTVIFTNLSDEQTVIHMQQCINQKRQIIVFDVEHPKQIHDKLISIQNHTPVNIGGNPIPNIEGNTHYNKMILN